MPAAITVMSSHSDATGDAQQSNGAEPISHGCARPGRPQRSSGLMAS